MCISLQYIKNKYTMAKKKDERLDAIKKIISSREVGSQDDLLAELRAEGHAITQATLSRDLKQLKVAKVSSTAGAYVYVLPNNTLYRRTNEAHPVSDMMKYTGFMSIRFSGNLAVIKTFPGYAGGLAYDIDNKHLPEIIGTVAGDDTILLVKKEGVTNVQLMHALEPVIPNIENC